MKNNLSSVEIKYLVEEFKEIVNAKVDKIYQSGKEEFLIVLHVPSKGKRFLKVGVGKVAYLASSKQDYDEPSSFCMFLRKYLVNSRLREIGQIGSERIMLLRFESKKNEYVLVLELFSTGNVVLCDKKMRIMGALDFASYKDRKIRKGETYKHPSKDLNLFEIDRKMFSDAMNRSKKDSVVTFLAVDLGMGGIFAEEACLNANVNKDTGVAGLPEKEEDKLFDAVIEVINYSPRPMLYGKEALPTRLRLYKDKKGKECESFSRAIEEIIEEKKDAGSPYQKQVDKLKRIIDSQEETIKKLKKEEKENREKGEAIYNNYAQIKKIMEQINKAGEKHSWAEIKEKLKGNKVVKEVDVKDKRIRIVI